MLYTKAKYITMKAKFILTILLAGVIQIAVSAANPGTLTQEQESTYWKAINLYQNEDYYASLLLFHHILDVNPENVELNYYVGMCYYNLGKPKLARWHFSIAAADNCCRMKIILLEHDNESDDNLLSYNQ